MMFKRVEALCLTGLAATCLAVDPVAIYNGSVAKDTDPIAFRIGNGGAGQSGLVGELANAYIKQSVDGGAKPFRVAWYKSDTTQSINYLAQKVVDIGITYTIAAEEVAVKAGIAKSPIYYLFRDHFAVCGPGSNPANLSESDDAKTIFSKIYASAERADTNPPTRFLSRYDKSATNIKDSLLWINIGQTPWATPTSTWYHEDVQYPIQALTAAAYMQEYTLTDKGTLLTLGDQSPDVAKLTKVWKSATDDEADPLLNPAHLLIGTAAPKAAQEFTDWAISDAGQKVITDFKKSGQQLYTAAPEKKTIDVKGVPSEPAKLAVNQQQERWERVVVRPGL